MRVLYNNLGLKVWGIDPTDVTFWFFFTLDWGKGEESSTS
jgi:hypothetical protein